MYLYGKSVKLNGGTDGALEVNLRLATNTINYKLYY